jgi:hypothetical protein
MATTATETPIAIIPPGSIGPTPLTPLWTCGWPRASSGRQGRDSADAGRTDTAKTAVTRTGRHSRGEERR